MLWFLLGLVIAVVGGAIAIGIIYLAFQILGLILQLILSIFGFD